MPHAVVDRQKLVTPRADEKHAQPALTLGRRGVTI